MPRQIDDWRERAACRGQSTDMFYAEKDNADDRRRAKAICKTCEVRTECLATSMDPKLIEQHGIWGGLTERERRKLPISEHP